MKMRYRKGVLRVKRLLFLTLLGGVAACENELFSAPASLGPVPAPSTVVTPWAKASQVTPGPRVIQPPVIDSPPPVATPAPAGPVPTVTPTPKPARPDGARAPADGGDDATNVEGSTGSEQTASPPLRQEAYRVTGERLDLALSGPGYFVLTTRENPVSQEDLLFTRYGHFKLQRESVGFNEVWRLRHADLGLFVAGLSRVLDSAVSEPGEPEEQFSATGVSIETRWSGNRAGLVAFQLDAGRNIQAGTMLAFDHTGVARVAGQWPRNADSREMRVYLPLVEFDRPEALTAASGTAHVYRYRAGGGAARIGVAVTGAERTLGNRHLVLSGRLEKLEDDAF